jgi:hypothetical protein
VNGCALDVEGERRIKKCLEAAIERRYSEVNLISWFSDMEINIGISVVLKALYLLTFYSSLWVCLVLPNECLLI